MSRDRAVSKQPGLSSEISRLGYLLEGDSICLLERIYSLRRRASVIFVLSPPGFGLSSGPSEPYVKLAFNDAAVGLHLTLPLPQRKRVVAALGQEQTPNGTKTYLLCSTLAGMAPLGEHSNA